MSDKPAWLGNAQCAVMLSFDFDAETLWLSRDPKNWKRPGTLSQGKYGATVGVPKILELLRDYEIAATFFVPGWTAGVGTRQGCGLRTSTTKDAFTPTRSGGTTTSATCASVPSPRSGWTPRIR